MIAAIPGIDETAPTLLYPGIFQRHPIEGARTWKSFDRTAMDRLHEKALYVDSSGEQQIVDKRSPHIYVEDLNDAQHISDRAIGFSDD